MHLAGETGATPARADHAVPEPSVVGYPTAGGRGAKTDLTITPPTPGKAPLKVLFVASEVAPFRKTGGLADVAGDLPRALARRGIDVRVVMPLYQGVRWNELDRLEGSVPIPMYHGTAWAGVRMGRMPASNVPIYFLEYNRFFDRPFLYGPPGQAYPDNLERFTLLSRGALELCKVLGWIPDVIHANDWQTALVPVYVNTVEWAKPLHGCATVYTIHNLAYQGNWERGALYITGLGWNHYNPNEFEHFGDMNLMKAAIRHATMLTTVSPTYAREIQTSAYGFGLDGELSRRSGDLRGLLNGIDDTVWNPREDRFLAAEFDAEHLEGKTACKLAFQKEIGLPQQPHVPLFGVVGRLTAQKGFDVLAHALDVILNWNLQMVLLGAGDGDAEHFFSQMCARRGDKFRAHIGFSERLAHQIQGASDFLLMPSRFEPCGLSQMFAQRYGTLPIVRATGGLVDTVQNYDERTGTGTGFVFQDLYPSSIANTMGWALSTYFDRPDHITSMRRQGMHLDYSWNRAAAEYEALYLEAYQRRRGHPFAG